MNAHTKPLLRTARRQYRRDNDLLPEVDRREKHAALEVSEGRTADELTDFMRRLLRTIAGKA